MGKMTIDATDRKILGLLIRNARMPFLEIARECGISGAAIHGTMVTDVSAVTRNATQLTFKVKTSTKDQERSEEHTSELQSP